MTIIDSLPLDRFASLHWRIAAGKPSETAAWVKRLSILGEALANATSLLGSIIFGLLPLTLTVCL